MSVLKLLKVDVQGFRSFGSRRQSFDVAETVTVLWGGNSQGKTSLAEAFEFLFTGQIARRELLASAKDEFSDSLRNAHVSLTTPVIVEAAISCADGVTRRLRRTLIDDFRGSSNCTSGLEIDGNACTEEDLISKIGLKLMPAPLRAPVLAQHTLGYIFSAGPAERATYFRAVLDTQDIEDFRNAVAALESSLQAPPSREVQSLVAIEAIPDVAPMAKKMRAAKTKEDLNKHVSAGLKALLAAIGIAPMPSRPERAEQLGAALEQRRTQTFPIALFARRPFSAWGGADPALPECINVFKRERDAVEAETRRLVSLYTAALGIEGVATTHDPIDCPLCTATATLTPARIAHLREQVAANKAYQESEKAAANALRSLESSLATYDQGVTQALPRFAQLRPVARREQGFTMQRLRALLSDPAIVAHWATAYRPLRRTAAQVHATVNAARKEIKSALEDLPHWTGAEVLDSKLEAVDHATVKYNAVQAEYAEPVRRLSEALNAVIDRNASTTGWSELLDLGRDIAPLWQALEIQRGYTAKVKALQAALKEIDVASGKVADEKFDELSQSVREWWERLRPDEPSFFEAVKRRGAKTRRTIDLKVGLSARDDRSDPKLRDAIAVFSQSQLHCLGLSLFLARAVEEKMGFVVLDDPVLSSDDDFRPNFESTVIEALLGCGVQVIVLTQDHSSWKNIGHRWSFRDAQQLLLVRNDPILGSEIRSENDQLAAMLAKAQPFIKSQEPDQRKQGATLLRQAIERFCKELLVRDRCASGDTQASITDYDGKNFGDFKAKVLALLTKDPSHPGKLSASYSYVTPGPHDDRPPSTPQLKSAAGDLKRLKKDYLD